MQAQKGWKTVGKHKHYDVFFASRMARSGQGQTQRLCLSNQCIHRTAQRRRGVISRATSSTWKDGCWESTRRETESLRQGGNKNQVGLAGEEKAKAKERKQTATEAEISVVSPLPAEPAVVARSKKAAASRKTISSVSIPVPSSGTEPVVQSNQSGGGAPYYQSIFFGVALGIAASLGAKRKRRRRTLKPPQQQSTEARGKEDGSNVNTATNSNSSGKSNRHAKMQYLQTPTEKKYSLSTVDASSLQKQRLEEIEMHIDKLYSGLDKMAEENKRALFLRRSRPAMGGGGSGNNQSELILQKKLGQGLERVEDEQRSCRKLLAKLEKDFEGMVVEKNQMDGDLDEHIKKTSAGFQDAIQALSVMKDKLGEFESKISQMEMEGSGSGPSVSGSVDVIVSKIEAVQKEQVQSAEEQASKMGEVSLKLEQMSDKSSLVMQELEDLKRSSKESETLARESSELSRSLKRDLDSIDLKHMRSQVDLAVERTNTSPQGLANQGSYNDDDSRRGAKDKEEEDSQIPAIEQEINAIKGALEGTRESMKMLGDELSNVTESIHSIKQTNKFSLFLHDFYSSLHTHMAKNNYTIQEVFGSFDGDKDGFLSGNELLQLLEVLVPGSSENDRKSLVFFVDPTNEDHIKYSRVLQNASNANKSSGAHRVKFHINYYTQPNQHLRIVGAHESLGWWRVLDAPCMYEVEHGVWETKLTLPGSTLYEYKYVVCDNKEAVDWLPGSNLVLDLPPGPLQKSEGSTTRDIYVEDKWNSHPPTESLDSTVNARSTIMRMLSAAGGIPEDRLR